MLPSDLFFRVPPRPRGATARTLRLTASLVAAALTVAVLGCSIDERQPANPAPPPTTTVTGVGSIAPTSSSGMGQGDGAPPSSVPACSAPSLATSSPLDARNDAAFARCAKLRYTGPSPPDDCGLGEPPPSLELSRLDAAVLPFERGTVAHLRTIAGRGRELGRNPRAFGLVGDSMTVSTAFFRAFAADHRDSIELSPAVGVALRTEVEGKPATIIDFYRGVQAQQLEGQWRDSFAAIRAAKVGARAVYAVAGGTVSPLSTMTRTLSPAVAVVLFGGNDAAFRAAPVSELADVFERDLVAVIEALEQAGIIPILNTVARHGHAPGIDDCGKPSEMTNWRIAVQTSALSARVVDVACRRNLPLIDLRHALDATVNHGLGRDGVHPSAYQGGSAKLTDRGLQCGYNVRNYVTLKMLKQVKEAVLDGASGP
ncbi:MAG: SGNH/GDSL hydrolase family protein [Deltaproteobacteria bacterium]|nr:SGNH/GDSL hydrolase family protein [Deltaproteobacteria bacterium]